MTLVLSRKSDQLSCSLVSNPLSSESYQLFKRFYLCNVFCKYFSYCQNYQQKKLLLASSKRDLIKSS